MSNYLDTSTEGYKGRIIISSTATPSSIVTLTESNASSVTSSNSIMFSPYQNGGLQFDYDSLATEDSGRSVDGYNHITWILTRARKLEIQLPPCSSEYLAAVLSRVMGKKYYVTYWDPIKNAEYTIYVYTSNGKSGFYSGVIRNGLYQGVSFNAIEIQGETS